MTALAAFSHVIGHFTLGRFGDWTSSVGRVTLVLLFPYVYTTMSSVYFPAHVVALFRRLVNVVSTISISTHYVGQVNRREEPTGPGIASAGEKGLLKNSECPPLNKQYLEGSSLLSKDIGSTGIPTINLPGWFHGWSNLFSSPEPLPDDSGYDHSPPPAVPPKNAPEEQPPPYSFPKNKQYKPDTIHQLLENPALLDPVRTPRYPIILCHGLYGFDSRGPSTFPSMRMHYWSNVLNVLRGLVGAEVIVTSVPGTGSIFSRASKLDEQLKTRARGRGVNFLAHSMGGLDCRHLISHIQPNDYAPLSLTSISTPHRGSPFMDWCESNIGIGKLRQQEKEFAQQRADEHRERVSSDSTLKSASESSFAQSLTSLPSSFTTLLLSVVDSPAYANLTSHYLNDFFNPNTPDDPRVKYFSVAGRMSADSVSIWHPFWLPKMVLDGVEEKERERLKKEWEQESSRHGQLDKIPFWADEREWGNDGLVTIQSAKWGEFLGTMEGCDHWEMRGARGIEFGVDIPAIPAIGLGSMPLASSLSNLKRPSSTRTSAPTAQGDGWGFGDWTRFVGAWMKSEADEAAVDKGGSTVKQVSRELNLTDKDQSRSSTTLEASGSRDPSLIQLDAPKSRPTPSASRVDAEDALVKSSTDTLSVVFDWLIERVPAPAAILRRSPAEKDKERPSDRDKGNPTSADREPTVPGTDFPRDAGAIAKSVSAAAIAHAVGVSARTGAYERGAAKPEARSSSPPSSPPSEMKRRMDEEDKGRRKQRELATKRDLERFYIALTRKMYDSGL